MKFLTNLSKKQIIIVLAAIVIGIGAIAAVAINAGGGKEKTVEETEKETEKTIVGNGITITGKLGNATKIKSEEIKGDSELYKEVADQVKNEVVVSFVSTDVKLLDKKDKEVQPKEKVKVTMTIPDSLVSGDDYQYDKTFDVFKVYTKSKSNGINLLDSDLSKDGKTITFETSYVSEFTISKENKDKSIESVEQLVTPVDKTMVAANDTTVYEGPDATYDEVGKLTQGQEVKVVGQYQKNEWYKVQVSEDKTGYVNPADLAEKQETTEEQPAEEVTTDNTSDNSGSSSSKKNNGNKSQSTSSGQSGNQSASSGSGQASSGSNNQAPAPQPQQPSNPKAGVAETFYNGSVANGLSGEQKAHVDSLVNSWLNGGYTNSGLQNEIINYLMDSGCSISSVEVEKDSRFLIPSGKSYSLSSIASGNVYYFGKMYTNGEMDGDSRVGYNTSVSIY
ncbi:MAG: SH3 domain-containing protein [Escherichia coli]|nr:SH3 domain-containing protein [Escherichia coli]